MAKKSSLNVRRLVGAILLLIFAIGTLGYSQAMLGIAWVGIVRQFQQFLYFYAAWGIGLAIWYFATVKSRPNRKAELIVKIIFYVVIGLNAIYGAMLDFSDATVLGIVLMIIYSIGCPWGKLGYKKHPYKEVDSNLTDNTPQPAANESTSKSWYQDWKTWVIIVLSIIVIFGAFFIFTDGSMKNSNSNNPSTANHSSHTITVDYKKYKIKSMKNFRINYTDDSWAGGDIKINKVVVYKTVKPYKYESANDGTFNINGFVKVYMTIKSKNDITINPTEGTFSYSNGEQHEADSLEDWDGNINNGVSKSGTITIPVEKLASTSSLKSIRMRFDGYSQDTDDESLDKNFDFSIDLK